MTWEELRSLSDEERGRIFERELRDLDLQESTAEEEEEEAAGDEEEEEYDDPEGDE